MKANNRSQHVLIRLLGAFVCGVGLVTLSADMARSGHTELPCDTMTTVFVSGLEGLMFELVPLRFLRGEAVYQWRRTVWVILFLAAGFAFAYILLDPSHGYLGSTRISPLVPAVILFVSFGIASILFWSYFRFRRRPKATL